MSAARLAPPPAPAFHSVTATTAIVASATTFGALALSLPPWAMFLGWVGYSIGANTVREGFGNLAAYGLGLALGVLSGAAIVALGPVLGDLATPAVVLGDVIVVLSLRNVAPIQNSLAWFVGLITWFASGAAPSAEAAAPLATAGLIGGLAAALVAILQTALPRERA